MEQVQHYSPSLSWAQWAKERTDEQLHMHIESLSETGAYGLAVKAAKQELQTRQKL